jgi:hypothetical protein
VQLKARVRSKIRPSRQGHRLWGKRTSLAARLLQLYEAEAEGHTELQSRLQQLRAVEQLQGEGRAQKQAGLMQVLLQSPEEWQQQEQLEQRPALPQLRTSSQQQQQQRQVAGGQLSVKAQEGLHSARGWRGCRAYVRKRIQDSELLTARARRMLELYVARKVGTR